MSLESLIDPTNIPTKKNAGKSKWFGWDTHIIQGEEISPSHWKATCKYCMRNWNKGSPQELEIHLANDCPSISPEFREIFLNIVVNKAENPKPKKRKIDVQKNQTKISDFHESTNLSQERVKEINRALVKAFVICGIPWHTIENPFFIEFLKTLRPAYEPPSRETLSGVLLSQEAAVVNLRIIKHLKNQSNLTLGKPKNVFW